MVYANGKPKVILTIIRRCKRSSYVTCVSCLLGEVRRVIVSRLHDGLTLGLGVGLEGGGGPRPLLVCGSLQYLRDSFSRLSVGLAALPCQEEEGQDAPASIE